MLSKIAQFIRKDVWRIRSNDLPRPKAIFVDYLRIFLAAFRGFDEHRCQLRASALTFFSLLSIVPVLAMAFGIAKGFYFDKLLQEKLLEKFSGQEEVLQKVFEFANSLLENTKGGLLAGIGVVVLFWTIIKLLGNIEDSLNDIWGIKRSRTLARKATDYLSVMLIAPVLLVLSSGATVFVATQVEFIAEKLELLGTLRPLIAFILSLSPYIIMWGLFSFIYAFIPNTRVDLKSALFAGILAGTGYQVVQWFYVKFQVGVAQYNAIYGSFAALPLFLVWLQLSWLIVLVGAEISHAHQNSDMLEFEPDALLASTSFRNLLALRVTGLICKNFSNGPTPVTITEIMTVSGIPKRLLCRILDDLSECGIITATGRENLSECYQPAIDTDRLTIAYVIEALETKGIDDIPVNRDPDLEALTESLQVFRVALASSPANKRLKDFDQP